MNQKKTWHDWYEEERSIGDHLSDKVAAFVGSWMFVTLHLIWFGFWIFYPVESFPYGLLTMIVSLEAIMLSTFIIMSQNREARRDRRRTEADYETDVEAKKEIDEIEERLKRIENEKLEKILKLLESDK